MPRRIPPFGASLTLVLTLSAWLIAARSDAQQTPPPIVISTDRAGGIYQDGDTVHWTIRWQGGTPVPAAHYVLKSGGATEVAHGDLVFTGGAAALDSRLSAPNTLLLEVDWPSDGRPGQAFGGAVAAPDRIKPAAPPPADFDAFWAAKVKELDAVPADPQLTAGESEQPGVSYWKVTLDNIRGTHVQGQIARPTVGAKFPAILQMQYAGVYGLQKKWVTDYAKDGWLAMDIEAHDIPIDQSVQYYQDQDAGPLHYYCNIGDDDRDRSYYLRMYLSCYQAVEYLAHRPDWDGKVLVVTGQSQGGQQTLMIAGLHPKYITAAMALVPADCDTLAPEAGRAPGFPSCYFNTQGKDPQKVHEVSRYYDPVNFARHIQCPVLIAMGLHDEKLAPPTSILAAANVITAPKEVIIMPQSGHTPVGSSQSPYYDRVYGVWLPALVQGRPAPVGASSQ
jgi:cephalosporin-C deacetylase